MEMFLIRLLYLKQDRNIDNKKDIVLNQEKYLTNTTKNEQIGTSKDKINIEVKNKTISQIKNFSQEETINLERKTEVKLNNVKVINFEELINLCDQKKELKLKYELETNVNLVSFADQKIEISFNENLDKNFVKELSLKLYEWTGKRWIIAFSKEIGRLSKKNRKKIEKTNMIEKEKRGDVYKQVIGAISDAELIDIKLNNESDD
jgi:DNA polymerase-3 subunit gamma/tau